MASVIMQPPSPLSPIMKPSGHCLPWWLAGYGDGEGMVKMVTAVILMEFTNEKDKTGDGDEDSQDGNDGGNEKRRGRKEKDENDKNEDGRCN